MRHQLPAQAPNPISTRSGIYIVTINNDAPMKIDLDKRRPDCLQVTVKNCKVGKAKNLRARSRCYEKIFGCYGTFTPIAIVDDIQSVEREILARLRDYRVKHKRRRLEWLSGIDSSLVRKTIVEVLLELQLEYTLL